MCNPFRPRTRWFLFPGSDSGFVEVKKQIDPTLKSQSMEFAESVVSINLDMICRDTALSSILEDVHDLGFDREQLSQYPDEPGKLRYLLAFSIADAQEKPEWCKR